MAFTPGQDILDTAIIGGGPAGLSTALGLARHLYQVVVFDSERYGNDAASSLHNLVTWDGKAPSEFREAARHNILDTYSTVHWEQTAVEDIVKTAEGNFRLVDAKGKTWSARTVVLATGSEILYPDDVLPGYSDCWASGMCVVALFLPTHSADADSIEILVSHACFAMGMKTAERPPLGSWPSARTWGQRPRS